MTERVQFRIATRLQSLPTWHGSRIWDHQDNNSGHHRVIN